VAGLWRKNILEALEQEKYANTYYHARADHRHITEMTRNNHQCPYNSAPEHKDEWGECVHQRSMGYEPPTYLWRNRPSYYRYYDPANREEPN